MKRTKYTPLENATKLVHKQIGIEKLPPSLSKLQDDLFSTHVKVEILIHKLIIYKNLGRLGLTVTEANINKLELILSPILDLSFARKLKYIKDHKLLEPKEIEEIEDLNNYRNEFTHSNRDILIKKFLGKTTLNNIKDVKKTIMSSPLVIYIEINQFIEKHPI